MDTQNKQGYKQTEVGLIPEEWEVVFLDDAVDFLDGKRRPIKSNERISGDYPYYGASGIIDYVNDYIFDDELILLGEDGENILSRNLPLAFKVKGKIWVNNHAHVLKPKYGFDITFLTEYLESLDYTLLNSGTAQPKLNKQSCQKIKIILPPLPEQTAIASALSDMDALIAQTEKLIEKKKAIKQGVMQELLTGKKRLKGFENSKGYKQTEIGVIPEDWEAKSLSELAFVTSSKRIFESDYVQNGIVFYRGKEVSMLIENQSFEENFYITEEKYLEIERRFGVPKKGEILITAVGTLGNVYLIEDDKRFYFKDGNLIWLKDIKEVFPKYLEIGLKWIKDQIIDNAIGSSQKALTINVLKRQRLIIPSLQEQIAIACALSDIDEDIRKRQSKLQKLKLQKQGMMQALLTGKIRLV